MGGSTVADKKMTKQQFIEHWKNYAGEWTTMVDNLSFMQVRHDQQRELTDLLYRSRQIEQEMYNIINRAARIDPNLLGE